MTTPSVRTITRKYTTVSYCSIFTVWGREKMSRLPPEKIEEVKQAIHDQLNREGIEAKVEEAVAALLEENGDDVEPENDLPQRRRHFAPHESIVDELVQSLQMTSHFPIRHDRAPEVPITTAKVTQVGLSVRVLRGKAFVDQLAAEDNSLCSTFTLYLYFRGQRFKSKPVPCSCDPPFDETFLFDFPPSVTLLRDLLGVSEPLHVVVIKTDALGQRELIGSHHVEWRRALASSTNQFAMATEIHGVGAQAGIACGILEILFKIVPCMGARLKDDVVTAQVSLEQGRSAEQQRLFFAYAKQWWREYLQCRPAHASRLVKVFAQDETGRSRLVCSFLTPLVGGRLIESPRAAARFVSLIEYERTPTVGGDSKPELWASMGAFLSKGAGNCEDHAVLLCSLLLGFGLDAYVCIGTKSKGTAHAWVATIGHSGIVTFWESLTGHRYTHQRPELGEPTIRSNDIPYRTVGCVFSHEAFYANCQPTDALVSCNFDLTDAACWKEMNPGAIESACAALRQPSFPTLSRSTLDPAVASHKLEQELKTLAAEHRSVLGLTSHWNDQLSYYLAPALSSYELEQSTGVSVGNDEFQQAVRRAVPSGHTFKAFPIQFIHANSRRIFATAMQSTTCKEIVECNGDQVDLAIRASVVVYPEAIQAVWIMFACTYRSII
ncbi:centrosomal protein of 76 kDa-like isoform X2 [Oscarella lobularis]|uniref:centrosomal protein of 76 kDa-like isoform X2 n=1 Tax=Oscarella lobularis TaxID=121494 RepID=UPI003313AE20